MKTFKKYNKRLMEDWGAYMSDEAKSFVRAFKNFLSRNLPGCELVGFKPNHYDTSGFVVRPDGKIIYVSYDLDRTGYGCMADFDRSDCSRGVLYRTAESTKDYRGGMNHFTSIYKMVDAILSLEANPERKEAVA